MNNGSCNRYDRTRAYHPLRVLRASAAMLCASALATACSGASDTGLFAPYNAPANGGDDNEDASTPHPDAGPPKWGNDATVPGDDADAAEQPDSTPPEDSRPPTDVADVSTVDVHVPGDPGIKCGNAWCTPGSEECCRTQGGIGGETFACVSPGNCAPPIGGGLAIPCDDSADCESQGSIGDVCCVDYMFQTGLATSISCVPAQACTGNTQLVMCDKDASSDCGSGLTCKPSTSTIPGYTICK